MSCVFQVADIVKGNPSSDVRLVLKASGTPDARRYNLPTSNDIAIVIPQLNPTHHYRDVVLYKTAKDHPDGYSTVRIHELHPMYDPTAYPLFFIHGTYVKATIISHKQAPIFDKQPTTQFTLQI